VSNLIEREPSAENIPKTEPPKRWRNWWRANVDQHSEALDVNGRETGEVSYRCAGDVWCSIALFFSQAQAEERAREILLHAADEAVVFDTVPILTYLGAYPEGDRP
jgi:hypothetical protein